MSFNRVYESKTIPLIGGAQVVVRLEDVDNWNDAPTLEVSTRFTYPLVNGEEQSYGYSQVIGQYVTSWEAEELYRAEVAKWEKLQPIEEPTREAVVMWPEHLKGERVKILNSPSLGVFNTVSVPTGEEKVFHADNLSFIEEKEGK